jgi:predicted RNA-binding Zn ribbon-like protein
MPWSATSRYGLVPAPGALGLVQDLLNTAPAGREPDLLADVASARAWVREATAQWSAATGRPGPEVVLDAGDLRELRAFRDDLREVTARADLHDVTGQADPREMTARADGAAPAAEPAAPAAEPAAPAAEPAAAVLHTGAAVLELGSDGSVRLRPEQAGRQALVTLVLAALYEGQHTGTSHRLKTCRNPRCRVAFYDRSRNASGVWHSVRICGNAINLRAHRDRRRAAV